MHKLIALAVTLASCSCATAKPAAQAEQAPLKVALIEVAGPITMQLATDLQDQVSHTQADVFIFRITTPGGGVIAGTLIAQMIEDMPQRTICLGDGFVMSMGAYLMQACDTRVLTDRTVMMIHSAALQNQDPNASSVENENSAKYIDIQNRLMLRYIARRSHVTEDMLLVQIAGGREYYILPEIALELGLADKIVSVDYVRSLQKLQ